MISRREILAGAFAGFSLPSNIAAPTRKPKVALIFTAFTYRSHAHVIAENILKPTLFCGRRIEPKIEIVSMYGDQFPSGEMSRAVSSEFGIPIFPTIREALTLGGTGFEVDGVLSIAEHGTYPVNHLQQILYPRKRFFDEIVGVMQEFGRYVPLYNDKHFSFRWDWAREMYDTCRRLGIPFMAGSSVPLAHREPAMKMMPAAKIDDILIVHGGGPDAYDFHALEVMQSITELRRGGETGVKSVQCLLGDRIWKAAIEGVWNPDLVEAALEPELGQKAKRWREMTSSSYLMIVRYRDGLTVPLLSIPGNRWAAAIRYNGKNQIHACNFDVGPWMNRNLFKALTVAIQDFMVTGKEPYPVERTLMTTGMTEANLISRYEKGRVIDTPHLNIHYKSDDFSRFCENGESWKLLTDGEPEPKGIAPTGSIILKH